MVYIIINYYIVEDMDTTMVGDNFMGITRDIIVGITIIKDIIEEINLSVN